MANNTNRRGFASMDPEKRSAIASMGGKAAHQKGTAHEFDSRSGQEAGRKGGKASHSSEFSEQQEYVPRRALGEFDDEDYE